VTGEGSVRRRRWWRWAVTAWAVAVALGGALTLSLQEDARPREPYVWQNGPGPTASPGRESTRAWPTDGVEEDDGENACPPGPVPSAGPVLCAYASIAG
jgi:hypothetical protein